MLLLAPLKITLKFVSATALIYGYSFLLNKLAILNAIKQSSNN